MGRALSVDVEAFERDGFGGPYYAMSVEEAQDYRCKFEAYEAKLGHRVTEGDPQTRYKTHVLMPFAADLARHPRILDAVEALLGPDISVLDQHLVREGCAIPRRRRSGTRTPPISACARTAM